MKYQEYSPVSYTHLDVYKRQQQYHPQKSQRLFPHCILYMRLLKVYRKCTMFARMKLNIKKLKGHDVKKEVNVLSNTIRKSILRGGNKD